KKTITSKIKSIKIKIVTKNNKIYFINLLNIEVKNTSMIYKVSYENAQKILSKLDMINTFYSDESPTNLSVADELSKLNSLLKEGILTQEEFESQKNKLLNK
ncbi:TPA: SHOCT domain-containing protein, partial [Clostridium perfringens]|nr:SHOCT domain-containing protein [Clostridium perfringens]HBI6925954.1 SHOCT domain-containing protein [Clostridium perfringens]HBI6928995.1 SHOCT domain-containing protein [Clostridium perfringens]HBI6930819.1 SHOCT domain-containing protein [Clostridium perfringens]HBI6955571.1 SHOCT domain-containing protein [Clostridium perfringens]